MVKVEDDQRENFFPVFGVCGMVKGHFRNHNVCDLRFDYVKEKGWYIALQRFMMGI